MVHAGEITESRIDESVRRILKLKFDLGLFENAGPDPVRQTLFEVVARVPLPRPTRASHFTSALMASRYFMPR